MNNTIEHEVIVNNRSVDPHDPPPRLPDPADAKHLQSDRELATSAAICHARGRTAPPKNPHEIRRYMQQLNPQHYAEQLDVDGDLADRMVVASIGELAAWAELTPREAASRVMQCQPIRGMIFSPRPNKAINSGYLHNDPKSADPREIPDEALVLIQCSDGRLFADFQDAADTLGEPRSSLALIASGSYPPRMIEGLGIVSVRQVAMMSDGKLLPLSHPRTSPCVQRSDGELFVSQQDAANAGGLGHSQLNFYLSGRTPLPRHHRYRYRMVNYDPFTKRIEPAQVTHKTFADFKAELQQPEPQHEEAAA